MTRAWFVVPLLVGLALAGCTPESSVSDGVVLEQVGPAFGDALQVGDRLVAWEGGGSARGGSVDHPFDLLWLAEDEAPKGPIDLVVIRDGRRVRVDAPVASWGLVARPPLPPAVAERYLQGMQSDDWDRLWIEAVERLEDDPAVQAWLEVRLAERLVDEGRVGESVRWFEAAATRARDAGDARAEVAVLDAAGEALFARDHLEGAIEAFGRALSVAGNLDGAVLMTASLTNDLGVARFRQGRLDEAEPLYRRAQGLWRQEAPGCRGEAVALNNLATVAQARGDIAAAEASFEQVLAVSEGLDPEGMGVAIALSNLGAMAYHRGDLATAQDRFTRSMEIRRALAPGSLRVATALNNLGLVAMERGDLVMAEAAHRDALAIRRSEAPRTLSVAQSLDNLGSVAWRSGHSALAAGYYREALVLREEIAPDSLEVARSAANLGLVAARVGDLEEAIRLEQRAFAIRTAVAPESLEVALGLTSLASLTADGGDLEEAERLHRDALAIRQRLAPGGLAEATSRYGLCVTLFSAGRLDEAAEQCRRAVEINQRLAPGSLQLASSRFQLGLIERRQGRLEAAREHFTATLEALESQERRLVIDGGGRRDLSERIRGWYQAAILTELELGQSEAAFALLERSRARQLRTMLASRDLVVEEVPEDLRQELRRVTAVADRARSELGDLDGRADAAMLGEPTDALRQALAERALLLERIRRRSPRAASLEGGDVAPVDALLAAVAPGTLILSYATGPEESVLFAALVGESGWDLRVVRGLPSETVLADRVARLRVLLRSPGAGPRTARALAAQSRTLFHDVLGGAVDLVAASERLLIVPDGPLRMVPFAALSLTDAAAETASLPSGAPLVQWRPLRTTASLALHASLPEPVTPGPLLAVADPDSGADRLPWARREVREVARSFAGRDHRVLVGRRAGEAALRQSIAGAGVVHVAGHATVDERFPLEARLILTPGGGHDGDLHAWEIIEGVRTEARLVTLSACETGIGVDAGSEGLIGLTRAFHFAGSPSVVASLWPVNDASTSALMARFYRRLAGGMAIDEALAAAQASMVTDPPTLDGGGWRRWFRRPTVVPKAGDSAHPYHWAGFQLSGRN
jgi:CHAT domain-containing protein/tetratricopeptide (TPR) repeat protein